VALALTRQKLPVLAGTDKLAREGVARGGYILREATGGTPQLIMIGTGSELQLAFAAAEALLATDGRRLGFSSFSDRAALVLIFSSNRCPTAKAYGPRMNELQRVYGPRGVQIVAINSNDPNLYPDESLTQMVERAIDDGYTFPYVVDAGQRVAKAYGATCTFHVFVLDGERRLAYEGRFDDSRIAANASTCHAYSSGEDRYRMIVPSK